MPFGWILGGLALGGAMGGIQAATAPGVPGAPDYGAANAAGVQADLETLPMRRQIEAAAALGKKVSVPTGAQTPIYSTQRMIVKPGSRFGSAENLVPYNEADFAPGGKYAGYSPVFRDSQVITGYTPVTQDFDFTGIGDVQNQAELSQRLAQIQLDLQKKYGPQFIQTALDQEAQADPHSVEARKLLADEILKQSQATPNRPVADLLDKQIQDELSAGKGLTPDQESQIQRVLLAREVSGDKVDGDINAGVLNQDGGAGNLAARQQKMLSYLTSGASPEDYAYRKSEQDKGNLGAYLSGQSPVAQFQQLSGSQQGASPTPFTNPLPRVNGNAGQMGTNLAISNYQTQVQAQSQQANPWMAGLSVALKGLGTAGAAGWKPFGG